MMSKDKTASLSAQKSAPKQRSLKAHQRVTNVIVYIILTVVSVIWIAPFFMIVLEFSQFFLTAAMNPAFLSEIIIIHLPPLRR